MTSRKRNTTQSERIGAKPFSGRRFVEGDVVRIEWYPGGKRRLRTIGPNTKANRKLADRILTEALARARELAGIFATDTDITLGELLVKYRLDSEVRRNPQTGKSLRATTLHGYKAHETQLLRSLDGSLRAVDLRRATVHAMIGELRRAGLADRTIYEHVSYLKRAYAWAVTERELLPVDPIAGVKNASRMSDKKPYTAEELHQLLETLYTDPSPRAWRFRMVIELSTAYGARISQILSLQWTDIDFGKPYRALLSDGTDLELEGAIILRSDAKGSKGQPDREVPMLPRVREVLWDAHRHRRPNSPWVSWCWRDDSRPSPYDSMNDLLKKLERRAGVRHIKGRAFHAFRRSVATAIVERRGVAQAARWIGDKPEVIMRSYVKPTLTAQADAAQFMSGIYTSPTAAKPLQGGKCPESDTVSGDTGTSYQQARQDSNLQPPAVPEPPNSELPHDS